MPTLDVPIRFTGPQLAAYQSLAPGNTVFLGWGRGTGKSHFLRTVCWLRVAEWDGKLRTSAMQPFRGIRIAWLMPSRKQFVDVHGAAILSELGGGGKFGFLGGKVNKTTWQIEFPGGSTLLPFPATEYNSQTARGIRADLVVVDECDDVGTDVYTSIAVPWTSANWSLREEILAGTPTRGRHGLWFRMLEMGRRGSRLRAGDATAADDPAQAKAIATIHSSHSTYADSPEIISADAVAKAKATTAPTTFAREWLADPDAGEGLVYPFDETFHVREPPPNIRFREYHVGMDHGFVDPGVMILFGIQGHGDDAVVWALDESYESGIQPHEWDERAKLWSQATFWPDPSRPDRVAALRSMGIAVGEVDNEILAGVARVADMMFPRPIEGSDEKWVRFFVSPKCRNLIREFGLYRRKKQPDGTFAEKPEDKNNHAMDATRYFMYGRFGRAPNYRTELRG